MKISRSSVLLLLVVGACTSNNGGGSGGASGTGGLATGAAGSGSGAAGSGAAGSGSGAAGNGAAGNGAAGSGSGAAGNGAAGNGGTSGAACSCQGTWKAVQYACGTDAPAAIPMGFTFTFGISGTTGMFMQGTAIANFSCTNSNNGAVTCDGPMMAFDTGPTMCNPENCLPTGCGMPYPQLAFTFTQPTPTTLTTVTPDTTPLTTCTSLGKSNPVTFYWEKQ